jgi:hypothetical protein
VNPRMNSWKTLPMGVRIPREDSSMKPFKGTKNGIQSELRKSLYANDTRGRYDRDGVTLDSGSSSLELESVSDNRKRSGVDFTIWNGHWTVPVGQITFSPGHFIIWNGHWTVPAGQITFSPRCTLSDMDTELFLLVR